jgi:hypothetical protein
MASITELLDKLKNARATVELVEACGKRVCSSEEHWDCPYGNESMTDCVDRLEAAYEDTIENLLQLAEAIPSADVASVVRWIPVTERLPEERVLVNVVWVNRAPELYYEKIKEVPFSDTACFYGGRWYWDSPVLLDYLAEYGKDEFDLVDEAVKITHWAPLPEPPEVGC